MEEEKQPEAAMVEEWLTWIGRHADRLYPLPRLAEEAANGLERKKWWW